MFMVVLEAERELVASRWLGSRKMVVRTYILAVCAGVSNAHGIVHRGCLPPLILLRAFAAGRAASSTALLLQLLQARLSDLFKVGVRHCGCVCCVVWAAEKCG